MLPLPAVIARLFESFSFSMLVSARRGGGDTPIGVADRVTGFHLDTTMPLLYLLTSDDDVFESWNGRSERLQKKSQNGLSSYAEKQNAL